MAEHNSRQAANVAAGTKMKPSEVMGKKRALVITSPATAGWAQNDTIVSGMVLPVGTRFLADSFVSHGAFGASVVMHVGIRNFLTKEVIDADGLAASIDVSAAGRSAVNSGALVKDGAEYITSVPVEVYVTLAGANPTDDVQFRAEISYLSAD